MSVKKQSSSLCKIYSFYKELPEEFLEETGWDSYFHNKVSDISQSQHRIVRPSKRCNKKFMLSSFSNFAT